MSLTGLFDVSAPAKLNLFLHVIGRRDDGSRPACITTGTPENFALRLMIAQVW